MAEKYSNVFKYYLDSNNLIHSVLKPIDPETNLVSDTLAYNFTPGNHILTVLIQDDGDNEDGTLLSDSNSVAWALGYAPLEFDSPGYYIITDSNRTLPPITIWNGEIESTINTENDLKILLPDDSEFKWAPSQGGISISGNSDLINSQADVSDDQLVLTFDVLTNFSESESLNITGIRIVDLTMVQGPTTVRMIVDGVSNYSTANSESGITITVGDTKVELSSTTAFSVGDPDSIVAPTIIIWENSPYTVLNRDIGINLQIPSDLDCDWNNIMGDNILVLRDNTDISDDVIDTIVVASDILSISLLENLEPDDTVKVVGSLFKNFSSVSDPSVISMAVSNPEQDSAYYFERSTQNTIRIGDPQVISTGNNILVVDIDPSYSDTLMPIKFIEDSQVGAITEANGLVLKLPESSALIWDQDNFDEIIMGEAVQQVMIDSNGNLKLDLGNDLSAGDTLIIRRLPVKNIVSNSYNQNLQCSTNGSNFNRNDPQMLSIGTAEIFSDDINFLLNDTSQTIPILLVQDPEVNLIRSQYGLYLFIDDAFPVVFDTSQHNLSYNYSNQDFSDSIRHISNKKIQLMISNEIAPSYTLSLAQLRFSGFSTRFFNNNLISLSVKDENHSSFTDSTYKGIGKPEFESDPRLVLSGSETSIIMPSIQVWDDNQVGVINSGRKISFILSDDYNVNWQQIPLLDISGAYDKVNPVPIFSEDQKRLSIQIMEDFSVEDSIIVNGLRVQAVGYGAGDLFLSINESTYQDTILNWIRSGDVSFNSSDQIFLKNVDLDQRILSTIKIGQGETAIID